MIYTKTELAHQAEVKKARDAQKLLRKQQQDIETLKMVAEVNEILGQLEDEEIEEIEVPKVEPLQAKALRDFGISYNNCLISFKAGQIINTSDAMMRNYLRDNGFPVEFIY
jgi:hypothetical protein